MVANLTEVLQERKRQPTEHKWSYTNEKDVEDAQQTFFGFDKHAIAGSEVAIPVTMYMLLLVVTKEQRDLPLLCLSIEQIFVRITDVSSTG